MKMKWCGEEWGVLSDRKEAADQEIEDILDTCQEREERLLNTGDRNYTANRFTVSSPEFCL